MTVIAIKGAKAGQEKARKPSIAKDSVASTSTAKLLYGLAEGEVWGLVDGGKSIRLDGTPLIDDAGNSNFEGVTWDFRHGTNEQEYIKGFPDVSNETPINVELRSSQPWIRAFTDTQLSAVRIRFKWNRLSKTNPDNGDVNGYKIDYAIDLQTDGGVYKEVLKTKIEDKTSAGYERTHRIDLPKSTTGWQIRVRRLTANDSSEYVQDDMFIDAVAEVIDVKLRYPNTALLGLQYNAETFSGIAKMAARIRGMIIRVPSNYDATARTYTGIWDGTFKDAYSNNPAWVYFDLCTQWRYGLGERLDLTMIDKWSLYALGQYCDQMVSDGQGGLEPRFTCNVYLQKQADAYQVLQNIAGIFRAMSYWNGEQVVLDADVPQDPVYTFSRANVIDGNFEYTGTRARDRHTLAKVAWDNPLNGFETEYEYIRDEKAMAKFGVKVLDLAAFGCTSQAQAQRAGLWALKTEQLETRQVSFGVGLDGFIPQVGNIINVSDELFAGRANGGRVSAVSDAQYVVTVDRDIVANIGDVLIVNGGAGQSERRNIKTVNGRKLTVTAPFTAAESENAWAIETADLKLMRFRVMSIAKNDNSTFSITAIQHEQQKYDAIDYGTDVQPTNITIVNPDVVDAPTSVTITSRHRVVQGQTIATLIIGWSQVKDAVAYDVEWRKDDGTWIKEPRTGNVSVEIEGVYSGNYTARVRSVSAFDVQSQATTSVLTAVEGKVGLPPKIVGLTATGVLFGMDLKWGFQQGSGDADYTEIQVGSAPNVNVATLGQYSYPTNTHTINGLQGNLAQSYRARLVDKLGFKSPWSAWVTGTTDANADKVMDLIEGQIRESSLNTALTTKIGKIDANETAISKETQDRIDAIIDANSKINTERDERIAGLLAANEGITTETTQRKEADVAINSRVDTVVSKTDGNTAAIASEVTARTNADGALSTRIDTVVSKSNNNEAAISSEVTARTNADSAISGRIDTVSSKTDTNTATITNVNNTLTNELGAQAEQINVMRADYKPQYADASQYADAARSVQWTYWKTVARDNYATNERITVLQSDVASSNATVTQSLNTLATKDEALASSIETLNATTGANTAAIQSEATARSNADTALGQRVDTVQSSTATAQSAANSAQSTANEALGKANTATSNIATIQTELTATTSKTNATATSVGTLQTTVAGNTASIQTAQSSIDGINLQYTVKLDSGGKISGFGLMNDGATSAFDIRADRFSISAPSDKPNDVNGNSPFMVLTNQQTINGVTVPAGVYARNFYAPRASIDTIQIKDAAIKSAQIDTAAIKSAQIDDAAITSAKIDDLAVTSGKIANLAVDTLQIADNAVTVPMTVNGQSSVPLLPTSNTEVLNAVIDTDLGHVTANINCSVNTILTARPSAGIGTFYASISIYADIYIDGAAVESGTLVYSGTPTTTRSAIGTSSSYGVGGTVSLARLFEKSASKKTLSIRLGYTENKPSHTSVSVISLHNKLLAIASRK